MPRLMVVHRKFSPCGFDTLAVAMSYAAPANVSHFAQTRALRFKVVIDNTGAVARSFGDIKLTPTMQTATAPLGRSKELTTSTGA